MTPQDLQTLISNGEDTRQQFKRDFNHVDGMAAELVAFANAAAGMLLFGKAPVSHLPAFIVKAVVFPGNVLHDSHYNDSEDSGYVIARSEATRQSISAPSGMPNDAA